MSASITMFASSSGLSAVSPSSRLSSCKSSAVEVKSKSLKMSSSLDASPKSGKSNSPIEFSEEFEGSPFMSRGEFFTQTP